jgi:hypothetical protein
MPPDEIESRIILVNELVSSILLQYLQLATPETAVIQITEEFLRDNPEASMDMGTRRQAHQPGWQFGSKYPGDPARLAVYDFLPDALLDQVTNYTDFLGALVFDKWVEFRHPPGRVLPGPRARVAAARNHCSAQNGICGLFDR